MATGLGFISKTLALGVGVTLSLVGWNAFSGKPISSETAIAQLSHLVADGQSDGSVSAAPGGNLEPNQRSPLAGLKQTASNVGTALLDLVASDEKASDVVVNRGAQSSRNAGGAKFVSTGR